MATYKATVMVNRPTFLDIEVEADDTNAAYARVNELVGENLGFKYIVDFDELVGTSQGDFDTFEILDVEVTGDMPHTEEADGTCTDECVANHPDHASTRGEDEVSA